MDDTSAALAKVWLTVVECLLKVGSGYTHAVRTADDVVVAYRERWVK